MKISNTIPHYLQLVDYYIIAINCENINISII